MKTLRCEICGEITQIGRGKRGLLVEDMWNEAHSECEDFQYLYSIQVQKNPKGVTSLYETTY